MLLEIVAVLPHLLFLVVQCQNLAIEVLYFRAIFLDFLTLLAYHTILLSELLL